MIAGSCYSNELNDSYASQEAVAGADEPAAEGAADGVDEFRLFTLESTNIVRRPARHRRQPSPPTGTLSYSATRLSWWSDTVVGVGWLAPLASSCAIPSV